MLKTKVFFLSLPFLVLNTYASISALGVQNTTPYILALSSQPSSENANCQSSQCFATLSAAPCGGQQWIDINVAGGWIDLEYDVCASGVHYDSTGKASCDSQIGHVGISFSQNGTLISNVSGGSAQLSSYDPNKPFELSFTPGTNNNFPTPSNYSGVLYRGVNLAGGEFDSGFALPYTNDALYYVQKGANTVRLPFKWEYLQPSLSQPINFSSGNAKQYVDLVNALTSNGIYVLVDMHNYMRYSYNGSQVIIGANNSPVTAAMYANAWEQIAQQFANNPYVLLDLMNEPNSMATEDILNNYNQAITAIRNAGFKGPVLLEGNGWSGLSTWGPSSASGTTNYYGTANSLIFTPAKIKDPANNYVINVHEYFTSPTGGGGGEGECPISPSQVTSVENLNAFVSYLNSNKLRAFLSETGGNPTTNCIGDIHNFLTAIEQNPNQVNNGINTGGFIGWTGWAGGHAWPSDYVDNLTHYADGSERPQMSQAFDLHLTAPK